MWHVPPGGDERGDYMLIGVYSSRDATLDAAARLADQPGFRDNPDVIDDVEKAGFFMESYALDQDHWTEGYRTEPAKRSDVLAASKPARLHSPIHVPCRSGCGPRSAGTAAICW